jgi:iron complex outermembrane receptor protein
MYSPFIPGTQLSSGGPGPLWNVFLQGAAAQDPALAPLVPALQSDAPGIDTYLLRFNQELAARGENPFLPDAGPTAIDRMKPTITNTFEVGYKGMASDRILVSADVYFSKVNDFVGPLRTETPSVFMDAQSIAAFVVGKLTPLVQAGQLPAAQMQAVAEGLASTLAPLPIGTVAPDQRSNEDLILTYRNFGDVDYWGADFAAQFIVDNRLSFRASGSYVSEECFDFNDDGNCASSEDIALNAPSKKGSFSARWSDVTSGWTLQGQLRYSDGFPMNSGVYIGDVDTYTVFDANVRYRIPMAPRATLTLTVNNVFDNLHQEFIGAPQLGRLMMLRLQYEF